ncbi:MAG: glycosyltransferase family 4 protein [Lachnospiraceae bacterium]|nr:glycosyltransferase family 4 protein [Lachnospiraceae bacterium]
MIGHKRIPSREGGVEIVVDELSTRMVRMGHKVDAYNRSGYHVSGKEFDENREKTYEGIKIITIPTFKNSSLNAMVYSILASIVITFRRYDVVHYHAEGPCTMLWLPKLLGKRVVATIHGLDWQRSKWGGFATKVLLFGEKMAAKYADEVIVLSENVQQYFREQYGRETLFVANGVNRPKKEEVNLIKEKYGLDKEDYILFLARIVPEKGVHYLIEAFSEIKTDKKLVTAGGISHSLEYMDKIRQMAAKDERIIMTDFVQGKVLAELCSNAYVFVLPSDVEGMAISLLEAMSYGNCCLVSDIRENTEVVVDYAVSFKKSDVDDLKRQLEYLLEHPEVVAAYQENSADYICERYNWDYVVEQTLEIYQKGEKSK